MEAIEVRRDDGQRGTVVERLAPAEASPQLVIAFADESRLVVPEAALVAQPDGTYHVRLEPPALGTPEARADEAAAPLVVPVVAEELVVEKRRVSRGTVRVHTRAETRQEVVDEPLVREEVLVEHVPVNAWVDGAAPTPHDEAGVWVIPILEEVLVVQKRLWLKEEVRVSKRRTTLRREVVEVERVAPSVPPAPPPETAGA